MIYCSYVPVLLKKQEILERRTAFLPDYYPMENNTQNSPQPTPPRRKQMAPRDMLLIALAVLVLVRVDWRHMNSFHYLILFLLVLCFMLRWSNMRKDARRQELLKKKAEYEATQQSAEDTPAEAVSAEDMTVDGAPVPAEAPAETAEKESGMYSGQSNAFADEPAAQRRGCSHRPHHRPRGFRACYSRPAAFQYCL